MTPEETLKELTRLRRLTRAERIERARQLSENFQYAAEQVKNGAHLEELPDDAREFLLECSDAVFSKFELLVARAPRAVRGHQFTSPRKAS